MTDSLLKKIQASRQSRVTSGEIVFIVTRPTDLEVTMAGGFNINAKESFARYVIGWENVKESDIYSAGDDTEVPFSKALFLEWIEDKSEHWAAIVNAIRDSYQTHLKKKMEAKKN